MKVDLEHTEISQLLNALDMYMRSAKRAQNTGRNPEIKEIWKRHESSINALTIKLQNIK